jgi:hypothetical protein
MIANPSEQSVASESVKDVKRRRLSRDVLQESLELYRPFQVLDREIDCRLDEIFGRPCTHAGTQHRVTATWSDVGEWAMNDVGARVYVPAYEEQPWRANRGDLSDRIGELSQIVVIEFVARVMPAVNEFVDTLVPFLPNAPDWDGWTPQQRRDVARTILTRAGLAGDLMTEEERYPSDDPAIPD